MMNLKQKTANTLKWNTIDRVSTQLLYAVIGVVLANILSHEDFGIVGALAIFQAFAIIFVDSGFGAALLREKEPSRADYSTVFWFNLIVSVAVYAILWFCAPLIARMSHNTGVLIPMSRVMFLTFVINGLAIVQTNRLMKLMNVKMIAIANSVALIISGIVGVVMAIYGYGAWSMVWYSVVMAAVKTIILWSTGGWTPSLEFKRDSMRKIRRVGFSVFLSSLLNTISQNIYNFAILILYGLAPLGVYTQADKYSKMGTAGISQVLTASFTPLLSKVQDSRDDFLRYTDKAGRFTSFILLPTMLILTVSAPGLFHFLFANKWDAAILLFQILCFRGIFIVQISLYNNYLLALGKARHLFAVEAAKDILIFAAIGATIWFHSIPALVWGLLAATVITWIIVLRLTSRGTDIGCRRLLAHLLPFLIPSAALVIAAWGSALLLEYILPAGLLQINALATISTQFIAGFGAYILTARAMRLPELKEVSDYLSHKKI